MATHSSVLAWRIPGTGEPGGPPSMGSHRVRHDIHSLDITIHMHILVYVEFIGIHIIAYLHTNIQTAKVLCIPIHIQSQQRYYMYPHMILCIIHVHMKQHAEQNISSEKDSLHSHLQNMPLHILVRAELIFYALCTLISRSIFTDANVFPNSYVQSLRGIRDMQIHIYAHTCLYTIHLYTHMYSSDQIRSDQLLSRV